ncbi:MAG: TrkH family potassium uptake protein, partial [Alphaproteobacteria bacterium]
RIPPAGPYHPAGSIDPSRMRRRRSYGLIEVAPVLFVCGLLLVTLSVAMLLPALVDLVAGYDDWQVFATASGITLFVGVLLVLTNRRGPLRLGLRQAFLLTSASWMVVALFGALPFAFSDLEMSFTDSVFESVSGVTTTGSTVIVGLDYAPPGILIWRALLQWLGGIGIIVTAVALLPLLQVGGMQLFRTESTDQSDKISPRVAQIALGIISVYLGATALWALFIWGAGLSPFDAVAHAMTTIATGGFSTVDASIGHFADPTLEWIVTAGMLASAMPYVLYVQALRGRPALLWRDEQVRGLLGIVVGAVLALAVAHALLNGIEPMEALRHVAFNAVSVMTGTGYATTDFGAWGPFATIGFFFLMFIGGCAGSTTCGIKVFRVQILFSAARSQIARLVQPHGVFVATYNRRPIPEPVIESVIAFLILYFLCYAALAAALGLMGLDFLTATSGAATAISNVGPGLGDIIGPTGTFAPLPDAAKWLLSFGMLLGRLELFTILVLFLPSFWRA